MMPPLKFYSPLPLQRSELTLVVWLKMLLYISKIIYKCVKVKEKVPFIFITKFERISLNRCTFNGAVLG